jgi:plastocyanin
MIGTKGAKEELRMSPFRLAAAAAALLIPSPPVAAQPARMQVQVWSYGFLPRPIRLVAGRPVTLTFVNLSDMGHDFKAPAFFAHARIVAGAAPEGEVDLAPRQSQSVTLIPARGMYQAHCSHFFHKQLGMEDLIVVE